MRLTGCYGLRREGDSNPRSSRPDNGFRDRPNRPLWHLSGTPRLFSMADANIADFVVNSRRLSCQASVQLKKPLRIYRAVNM